MSSIASTQRRSATSTVQCSTSDGGTGPASAARRASARRRAGRRQPSGRRQPAVADLAGDLRGGVGEQD